MTELLLSFTAVRSVAPILLALLFVGIYAFLFALVIICLIRVARYFANAGKEQKLMRLELGKVAEEVHLLRQELKSETSSHASPE